MTCFLCGSDDGHHLGCVAAATPSLTVAQAVRMGLLAPPAGEEVVPEPKVEILREGSMTTVPESVFAVCDFEGCDNPKYSASARAKWCDVHKDPNTRKE